MTAELKVHTYQTFQEGSHILDSEPEGSNPSEYVQDNNVIQQLPPQQQPTITMSTGPGQQVTTVAMTNAVCALCACALRACAPCTRAPCTHWPRSRADTLLRIVDETTTMTMTSCNIRFNCSKRFLETLEFDGLSSSVAMNTTTPRACARCVRARAGCTCALRACRVHRECEPFHST